MHIVGFLQTARGSSMEKIAVPNALAEKIEEFMYERSIDFNVMNIEEVVHEKGKNTVYGVELGKHRDLVTKYVEKLLASGKKK